MDKKQQSTNLKAEMTMGRREGGTPFQLAWELGYVCPICHTKPNLKNDKEFENNEGKYIRFSEYNGFLWCPVCNVDVPFAFCFEDYFTHIRKNIKDRDWFNVAIDRFLEFVDNIRKGEI